jgi:hypothetical protein
MEEEQVKHETHTTAPMAGMLNTLLSNPELLQKIGKIMGAMQTSATPSQEMTSQPDTPPKAEPSAPAATQASASIPTDGLASLLSDPSALEKLPQIIAVMKPLLGSLTPSPPVETIKDAKQSPELCRDNLLCALKPFLSPERCRAIDMLLGLSRLGDALQKMI